MNYRIRLSQKNRDDSIEDDYIMHVNALAEELRNLEVVSEVIHNDTDLLVVPISGQSFDTLHSAVKLVLGNHFEELGPFEQVKE